MNRKISNPSKNMRNIFPFKLYEYFDLLIYIYI